MRGVEKNKRDSKRILIIVENLPVPFDRRVWSEAKTLQAAGYEVSVICPKARGFVASEEIIDGIRIYRHSLPMEARGPWAYLVEYPAALFWEFVLCAKVWFRTGFDVIHACNPPDLIFIVALFYKVFLGKKFLFDHHDANPELYEAKFGRRDFFWRVLRLAEWLTFRVADISIATNESYRRIAIERGGMAPENVFIVRSAPTIETTKERLPNDKWRNGRKSLVGYVGVIGQSEGLDLLLESIAEMVYARKRNDVQFVIVGSGPEWPAIVALCEKLKLQDWVTFTGRVDDATLFEILATADVCVNPDRVTPMNEISTMNKVMEYMALGKAMVQYDVKEGRFSAQESSLYAKANDPIDFAAKILDLIDHPEKRDAMGRFGRQRFCDTLAWDYQASFLIQAYDRLFASEKTAEHPLLAPRSN